MKLGFALSMALAFLAFGLWLRLGRLGKSRQRALLFVPISFIVYFAHTFGWGMLGLLCFSAEAVRQADSFIKTGKTGADSEKQLFDCILVTKDNADDFTGPFTMKQ